MAELAINGIIGSQWVGQAHGDRPANATLKIFDLDNGEMLTITLQGSILSEQSLADKTPKQYIFGGVQLRKNEKGSYLVAEAVHSNGGGKPAGGK